MGFNQYTLAALEASKKGGDILKSYYNRAIKINFKGKIDPVTIADVKSQKAIISYLKKKFPSHSFLAEETADNKPCGDYCWIIDPLDGTVNFVHGVPLFCVSIALSHNGTMVSGVVHSPVLGETFVAQRDSGAWLNGKRISVSSQKSLVRSLAITGFPYSVYKNPQKHADVFAKVLSKVQGVRRFGSAAIDLAYVSSGRCEAFWEEELKPWDVAAGSLLISEAGGRITDFKGGDNYIFGGTMLASNGAVHKKMLETLTQGRIK